MAIRYVTVKKTITVGTEPGVKYMAQLFSDGSLEGEELLEAVAKQSTVGINEVKAILREMANQLKASMLAGEKVQLDVGTFSPCISAKAVSSREKADESTVTRKYIGFRLNAGLKQKMKEAPVKKISVSKKGLSTN